MVDLDRNELFEAYLKAIPAVFRQEHTCSNCKLFLRNFGGVVTIIDNKVHTLWEFEVENPYEEVPKALHKIVKAAKIVRPFLSKEMNLGKNHNTQIKEGVSIRWEHFAYSLPSSRVLVNHKSVGEEVGRLMGFKQVVGRSLEELTLD